MANDPRVDIGLAFGSSKHSIEESRRLIDHKKVNLYELIRQLNSRRNELAPISDLPPELLARIFTFVIPERGPDDQEYFTPLLNITHVSQQWRNVALDTPGLWNSPPFFYPSWARVMLERSKMADLVVHSNTSRIANPAVIKEVFDNHAARIREIDLSGLTPSFLSLILANVQPSSLRLCSLHLSTSLNESWAANDDGFPVFPAHLLVQPDCLRRLTIDRCAFDLSAQPYPMLTSLMVYETRDRIPLHDFVTALSAMPALETLAMTDSLPLAPKPVKLGLKVELPKLSFLRLSSMENIFEVLNILGFLIVPSTTRINLSCTEISQPRDAVSQLSDIGSSFHLFFSRMTGTVERRSYDRLRLSDSTGALTLSAWRNKQAYDPISTDLPELDLSLFSYHTSYLSGHFLDGILPFIPLSDLQTLVINNLSGRDPIRRYFGQFTTIQTVALELQSDVVSALFQALTHKPEGYDHHKSSYYSVSFPALQVLDFYQITFDDDKLGEAVDCLMERCERGAELQKLVIRSCYNIDHQDIRLLREIVPDVEWDEIVQTEESDDYSDYGVDYSEYSDASEGESYNYEPSDLW